MSYYNSSDSEIEFESEEKMVISQPTPSPTPPPITPPPTPPPTPINEINSDINDDDNSLIEKGLIGLITIIGGVLYYVQKIIK